MVERVLLLMKVKNLSPSKFADDIGIQRSGMSHIMSGRNLPSLDFVVKVLQKFPDVNSDWLVRGQGPMLRTSQIDLFEVSPPVIERISEGNQPRTEENVTKDVDFQEEIPNNAPATLNRQKETDGEIPHKIEVPAPVKKPSAASEKEVEKIVVFYSDRTFAVYSPAPEAS